jgi:hypothetical protein
VPAHQLGEAEPLDILHDEEVQAAGLVGVEGGDDVGVLQPGRRPHLLVEALQRGAVAHQAGVDHLEGDQPLHAPVFGLVDRPHAALADQAQHPIARVIGQFRGDACGVGGRALEDGGVGGPAGRAGRGRAGGTQPVQEAVTGGLLQQLAAAGAAGQVLFQGRGIFRRQTALTVHLQVFGGWMFGNPLGHDGESPRNGDDQK